jgi:hypothetical protein
MLLLLSLNIVRVEEVFELAKWDYAVFPIKMQIRSDQICHLTCLRQSHQANSRIFPALRTLALATGALIQAWQLFVAAVAFFCQNTIICAKTGLVFFVLLFQLE